MHYSLSESAISPSGPVSSLRSQSTHLGDMIEFKTRSRVNVKVPTTTKAVMRANEDAIRDRGSRKLDCRKLGFVVLFKGGPEAGSDGGVRGRDAFNVCGW